jgi:hypothetical protein
VALQGESTWAGCQAARVQFSRELALRTNDAQNKCQEISTLVLDGTLPDAHGDLAVRHGITAVLHTPPSAARRVITQPRTLRFGLWSFPLVQRVPGDSRWLPGGGGARAARSTIEQAIIGRALLPLVIDMQRLEERGHAALRVVDAVLAHARWRKQQNTLDVVTFSAATAALAQQRQSVPSQSILRAA